MNRRFPHYCALAVLTWLPVSDEAQPASPTTQFAVEASADSIRKYRFLAKTARETKDLDGALGYYAEYLKYETKPERQRQTYFFVGKMLATKKQYGAAVTALRKAITIDSLYVNPNLLLYSLYLQTGKPDSAARSLERVVAARPDEIKHRRKLADLYRRESEFEAAVGHYEAILESDRDPASDDASAEVMEILSLLHEDMGQSDKALTWRSRLLEMQSGADISGTRETLEKILRLQLGSKDKDGALGTLKKLIQEDPTNRFSYYSQMTDLAESSGDKKMRLKGLEGMVEAEPGDIGTVAALVELHLHEQRVGEARRWLEQGLRVSGNSAHLQLLRGELLVMEGSEEEALEAFERAKADPAWERIAQQKIWLLRPPETEEEKLKREFFGQ